MKSFNRSGMLAQSSTKRKNLMASTIEQKLTPKHLRSQSQGTVPVASVVSNSLNSLWWRLSRNLFSRLRPHSPLVRNEISRSRRSTLISSIRSSKICKKSQTKHSSKVMMTWMRCSTRVKIHCSSEVAWPTHVKMETRGIKSRRSIKVTVHALVDHHHQRHRLQSRLCPQLSHDVTLTSHL